MSWLPNTKYIAESFVLIGEYTYKVLITHTSGATFSSSVTTYDELDNVISTSALSSSVYSFFVGNIRLKKKPYLVQNRNKAPYSPEGDVQLDADFAVDGTTNQIRLTTPLSYGTTVTVVKRTGVSWDSSLNILEDDGEVGRFLRSAPGIWYVDERQEIYAAPVHATFDTTEITWDSSTIHFAVDKTKLAGSFDSSSASLDSSDATFDQGS